VRCEACHGPGSNHAPNPGARDLYVNSSPTLCGECHTQGDDPDVIVAKDGFFQGNTQVAELRASGGHAAFDCGFCHDPHASVTYERERGLRNNCVDCHSDMNMARHTGAVYVRGDYSETLSCESCHMPLAGLSASMGGVAVVGPDAKVGDVRSHIFRINVENQTAAAGMFSEDGTAVRTDASGQAAVTLDFVCLRCHNGAGNGFSLTLDFASQIAEGMHAGAE
jgi:hypothetical protein